MRIKFKGKFVEIKDSGDVKSIIKNCAGCMAHLLCDNELTNHEVECHKLYYAYSKGQKL
jgi:hypothetical protein